MHTLTTMRRLALILTAAIAATTTVYARRPAWTSEADLRKSDYTYIEAQKQSAMGNNDAYFELLRHAERLQPRSYLIAQELGLYYFLLSRGDSAMMNEGYDRMLKYYENSELDYYNGMVFGNISDRMGFHDKSLEVWRRLHALYPRNIEVTVRLADELAAGSADTIRQREALQLLDSVRMATGPSIEIASRRVNSFAALRDTAAIIAETEQFIADAPMSAEARVFAGDIFTALGMPDSGLVHYRRATEVDPASGIAYYKLAEYYKQAGDSAAYDREVSQALQLPDIDLDTKLEIATEYTRQLYADTLQQSRINDMFAMLVDQYPHEAPVHDLYSSYFVAVGDYASAAEQQQYVIDTDPSDYSRWRGLISLYFSGRDYRRAYDAVTKALELFPDDTDLQLLGGDSAGRCNLFAEADSLFTRALESPDVDILTKSNIHSARADMVQRSGDKAKAEEYYALALEENPLNAMTMNNYAYMLSEEPDRLEKAEELSRRSLEIAPDNTSALDTYAWIQFKMKNYAIAKEYIDRTIDLTDPADLSDELYEHAGDIYYMNDLVDRAVDFWKKGLKLNPDNSSLKKKIERKAL